MDAPKTFCPECGAPAPFRPSTVSLVCEYCDSTIVRTGVDVALVGKVSHLVDTGSPILLGSRATYEGVPFEVAGRLQVTYERGTWNEWFLTFADGSVGWLADAMGQFAIVRPMDAAALAGKVPRFHDLRPNTTLPLFGKTLLITDARAAAYKGAEGVLPFDARPGMEFYGVDLRGPEGEFATLDYGTSGDHQQPVPYFGGSVQLDAIGLHPLRTFEGWRRAQ